MRGLLRFLLVFIFLPFFSSALLAAMPVSVVKLTSETVPVEYRYVGRIEAINAVVLHSRTEGFLEHVFFNDGQFVQEGDQLYRLDSAQHHAALMLAQAQVQSAQATFDNSERLLARYQSLSRNNSISQNELDNAQTQRNIALAALNQTKAQLATQQLNFDYTVITAPISGRIGVSHVRVGTLVNPASGPLVDIVQLDPIRVTFSINEREFIDKSHAFDSLSALTAAYTPTIKVGDNTLTGQIVSVSNQIDPLTASVQIRAQFDNPRQNLLPGGTANIVMTLNDGLTALMLPATALLQDAQGHFVFVVNNNQIEQRYITLGEQIDRRYRVVDGLTAGELVVIDGIQHLRSGMLVTPQMLTAQ